MKAFVLILVLAALPGSVNAANSAERSPSRVVSGTDMAKIRDYSDQVGKGLLREEFGLDLDSLRLKLDSDGLRLEETLNQRPRSAASSGVPSGNKVSALIDTKGKERSSFSLALDQRGDLLRLRNDMRDIPFGVKVRGNLPVLERITGLQTELWVPFSWRDELVAEAKVPLPNMSLGAVDRFLMSMGLSDHYALRSDYRSRLGVNTVGAGVGTQWGHPLIGMMDLDYDYSQRYGQGLEETIHWLKLRKDF